MLYTCGKLLNLLGCMTSIENKGDNLLHQAHLGVAMLEENCCTHASYHKSVRPRDSCLCCSK